MIKKKKLNLRKDRNILIRKLSKADNVLLDKLRVDIDENTNTKAVMGAVRKYFAHKTEIEKLQGNISRLEERLEQATDSASHVKEQVRDFFSFQEDTEKQKADLLKGLKLLVTDKKSTTGRAKRGGNEDY